MESTSGHGRHVDSLGHGAGEGPSFLVFVGVVFGAKFQVGLLVDGQCELNERCVSNGQFDALMGRYDCGDVLLDRFA